jgi:hypothetical protein
MHGNHGNNVEDGAMSLDIYLEGPETEVECECRECGHMHTRRERRCFYNANITHNLGPMAEEAGIYYKVWRPEEVGVELAEQLIEPLRKAIADMAADPARFEKFNAKNGWGLYEHFLPWLRRLLDACEEHPQAHVRASR